jgi:hypothetical protein
VPGLLEAAPRAMVELLEAAAPLLQATVGEDVQIICFQARVVPSGGGEYGGWHRDSGSPADNPQRGGPAARVPGGAAGRGADGDPPAYLRPRIVVRGLDSLT